MWEKWVEPTNSLWTLASVGSWQKLAEQQVLNTVCGYAKSTHPVFPTSLQESVGVLSVHFVMPWFLTLFSSLPCWDSVLAVWDLIILHGKAEMYKQADKAYWQCWGGGFEIVLS